MRKIVRVLWVVTAIVGSRFALAEEVNKIVSEEENPVKYAGVEYQRLINKPSQLDNDRHSAFSAFDYDSRYVAMFEKIKVSDTVKDLKYVDANTYQGVMTKLYGANLLTQSTVAGGFMGIGKSLNWLGLAFSLLGTQRTPLESGLIFAHAKWTGLQSSSLKFISVESVNLIDGGFAEASFKNGLMKTAVLQKSGVKLIPPKEPKYFWAGQNGTAVYSADSKYGRAYTYLYKDKPLACALEIMKVGNLAALYTPDENKVITSMSCYFKQFSQSDMDELINDLQKNVEKDTYILWTPIEGQKRLVWKNGLAMEMPIFPMPKVELEAAQKAAKEAELANK